MLRGYVPDGQGTGGYSVSGGVALSTLVTGLVAYWSLDETSGTRADSVGTATLSDNNTVLYDTGINSNAASFVSTNNETLSVADGGVPEPSATDMTWSVWFYPTVNDLRYLLAKSAAGTDYGPYVFLNPNYAGGEVFVGFCNSAGSAFDAGGTGISGMLNNWNHLIITWKLSTQVINAYVANTALAKSPATLTGTMVNNAGAFILGGVPGAYWDGYIDEVGIWSRVLTSDERAELYNSGTGKFYNGTNFV